MQDPELIQELDMIRKDLEDKRDMKAHSGLNDLISKTEGTVKARLEAIKDLNLQRPPADTMKAIDAFIIDLEG